MSQIATIQELNFYIKADQIVNRGGLRSWKRICFEVLFPDYIMKYIRTMRLLSYCMNTRHKIIRLLCPLIERYYTRLGIKLCFDIHPDVFSYGLSIPHWGTIVVGGNNTVGAFAVLHTSTCISHSGKTIGDGLYLSTGSIILGSITLRDHVTIAPNSCVKESFCESGITLGGTPSTVKKKSAAWWERDGEPYTDRIKEVERIKAEMGL